LKQLQGDVLDRAAYLFAKLGMQKTDRRNGVLFYLAVKKPRFAVIGDKGINAIVPENFWMTLRIPHESFQGGKIHGRSDRRIAIVGKKLKTLPAPDRGCE